VRGEWRDVRQLNLELRVTANGAKTWRLHYTRSDGRRKAMKLGRYSADGSNGLTLGQARKKARELRVDDDRGMLKRHINPVLGHLKIQELRKADVLRLNRLTRGKTHAAKGARK
jgi:hypothetical protein